MVATPDIWTIGSMQVWGPLYYNYNKEPPKHGNYLGAGAWGATLRSYLECARDWGVSMISTRKQACRPSRKLFNFYD